MPVYRVTPPMEHSAPNEPDVSTAPAGNPFLFGAATQQRCTGCGTILLSSGVCIECAQPARGSHPAPSVYSDIEPQADDWCSSPRGQLDLFDFARSQLPVLSQDGGGWRDWGPKGHTFDTF